MSAALLFRVVMIGLFLAVLTCGWHGMVSRQSMAMSSNAYDLDGLEPHMTRTCGTNWSGRFHAGDPKVIRALLNYCER